MEIREAKFPHFRHLEELTEAKKSSFLRDSSRHYDECRNYENWLFCAICGTIVP